MGELYELPEGWEWKQLVDVASISNKTVNIDDDDEYNCIGLEHIESNTGKLIDYSLSNGNEIKSSKVVFVEGMVLYGKLRPYLNKVWTAKFDGIATTEILPFKPRVNVLDSEYLSHYLRTNYFVDNAMKNISGARMPRITTKYIKNEVKIPLPPLKEQKRIVAKLDSLFSKIDQAIALHQQNIDEADALMGSVLGKVFEGTDKKINKKKLTEVVKFIGGSQPPKSVFSYTKKDGYVRLIQIRDYKTDNHIVYISEDSTKKFCTEDDIMIGRYGPPVFQILRGLAGAYNVALMKAEPITQDLSKEYLYRFLQNPSIQNYIIGLSQRSAGQSGVNKVALEEYEIFLPDPETQQKTVTYLDQLSQKTEKLKQAQQEKMQSLKDLKASLLDRAFRGEL